MTGLRNAAAGEVTVRIGGEPAEVTYSGPQSSYAGLDQVNVRIPRTLQGRGEVAVELTAAGKTANTVTLIFH